MLKTLSVYDTKQLSLFERSDSPKIHKSYLDTLVDLLSNDLDFHRLNSIYASHNFHSFPAKFPPQLPAKFLTYLTKPGEIVLDPMMGSGTTVLETYLAGRKAVGFDIDPLALKISRVKTTPLQKNELKEYSRTIIKESKYLSENRNEILKENFQIKFDQKTQDFVNYWFSHDAKIELLALSQSIKNIDNGAIRMFFELIFSSIIITKSGGVSLALDLAHTRPHRAKIAFSKDGQFLFGKELSNDDNPRIKFLTKKYRSPIDEFAKKFEQNLFGLINSNSKRIKPDIQFGNAQNLPLDNSSVDLIVTSPPYASNAIDYMRAHKFSLVWFDYSAENLTTKRKEYIGGELTSDFNYEELPDYTTQIVNKLSELDSKKGKVLLRYYSEMIRVLREMYRVLKPGKAAIVVVGNSVLRGMNTETQNCLVDIGKQIGFEAPKIGVRKLDRNKRMMPAGFKTDRDSQIQKRMHEEYVIGFYKSQK